MSRSSSTVRFRLKSSRFSPLIRVGRLGMQTPPNTAIKANNLALIAFLEVRLTFHPAADPQCLICDFLDAVVMG